MLVIFDGGPGIAINPRAKKVDVINCVITNTSSIKSTLYKRGAFSAIMVLIKKLIFIFVFFFQTFA